MFFMAYSMGNTAAAVDIVEMVGQLDLAEEDAAVIDPILARYEKDTLDPVRARYFAQLDMQDASQIPAIVEPWFLAFNASIEIHPVMVPEDLGRAGSAIEAAVKKYS